MADRKKLEAQVIRAAKVWESLSSGQDGHNKDCGCRWCVALAKAVRALKEVR